MLVGYKRGQGSVIIRVKILDSAASTGAGKTGLANNTSGLIISTIADTEATATAYTVAASNVETITTLGTYAAPSSGKCRFREVDGTNHKGVYELQFADARFAVSGSKSLLISISGASGAAECDVVIPLRDLDPYTAALASDVILADSVPADGTRPTPAQALYMITQFLLERAVSGTTVTVRKVDGSTSLMTFTIDNATAPTSITRAT